MTRTLFATAVILGLCACPSSNGQPDGGSAAGGGTGTGGGAGGGSAQAGPSKAFVISHNETGSLQQVKTFGLPARTVGAVALPQNPGSPVAVIASRDGAKVAVIGARDDGMGNVSDFAISLGDVNGPLQQATIPASATLSFLSDSSAAWYRRAEDLGVWSPDNQHLALAARHVGVELSRIYVLDATGAKVTEVDALCTDG